VFEGPPLFGQLVLDPDRRLRDHDPRQDPFRFQFPQPFRKHPVADLGDGGAQFGEPHPAVEQQLDDRSGPPPANQLDRAMKPGAETGFEAHALQCIKSHHLTQATYLFIVTK
jgi:hypothetical protein